VEVASQLLSMLPYLATIVVLVLISATPLHPVNMPASLGKPFHPGPERRSDNPAHPLSTQEREPMTP
jgi:hypothetical protein